MLIFLGRYFPRFLCKFIQSNAYKKSRTNTRPTIVSQECHVNPRIRISLCRTRCQPISMRAIQFKHTTVWFSFKKKKNIFFFSILFHLSSSGPRFVNGVSLPNRLNGHDKHERANHQHQIERKKKRDQVAATTFNNIVKCLFSHVKQYLCTRNIFIVLDIEINCSLNMDICGAFAINIVVYRQNKKK